jgi:hypothetical protein
LFLAESSVAASSGSVACPSSSRASRSARKRWFDARFGGHQRNRMDAQAVEQELRRRRWKCQAAGWRSQHEFEAKVFEGSLAEALRTLSGIENFRVV